MSSGVPSNKTFFTVLSFLTDYSKKTDRSLVGYSYEDSFFAADNTNTHFIEKLLNLTVKSVAKQYKKERPDIIEIYTPEFMPVLIKFVPAEACLKQLEYIDYQIESPELDYEVYSQLKALQLHLLKEITEEALENNKKYKAAPFGVI